MLFHIFAEFFFGTWGWIGHYNPQAFRQEQCCPTGTDDTGANNPDSVN
jgi:hypothetical protein